MNYITNLLMLLRGVLVKKLFKFIIFLIIVAILLFVSGKAIYKTDYLSIIGVECQKYNIDKYEILSIIKAESNFKPDAVSSKKAIGLMQLTLDTANWCAEKIGIDKVTESDLYVPETNIKLGVYYYSYLFKRYDDFDTTLAAYNAGMGNVDKWLINSKYSDDTRHIKTTPYQETNRYITKINNNLKIYKFLYKELKL